MKKDTRRQQTGDRDGETSDRGKAERCIGVRVGEGLGGGGGETSEDARSRLKPAFF